MKMKTPLLVALLAAGTAAASRAQVKDCNVLKQEIEAKLRAKGVASYTLEIVPATDTVATGKVVGTCAGGTRKIVYTRSPAKPPSESPKSSPPAGDSGHPSDHAGGATDSPQVSRP